jgi:hypothetical protein
MKLTQLRWDDATGKFNHTGVPAWSVPDSSIVEIIGR